jgi:hypothetical protein
VFDDNNKVVILDESNQLKSFSEDEIRLKLTQKISDYFTYLNLSNDRNLKTKDYLSYNLSPIEAFKKELSRVYDILENENIKIFNYEEFKNTCNEMFFLSSTLNRFSLYNKDYNCIIETMKSLNSVLYYENKKVPFDERFNLYVNSTFDEESGENQLYYQSPHPERLSLWINKKMNNQNKLKIK